MDQQGSPCCHIFLTVIPSCHSKVIPIGTLHAEKIAEAVLLYVFKMAFPSSLSAPPPQFPACPSSPPDLADMATALQKSVVAMARLRSLLYQSRVHREESYSGSSSVGRAGTRPPVLEAPSVLGGRAAATVAGT